MSCGGAVLIAFSLALGEQHRTREELHLRAARVDFQRENARGFALAPMIPQ